MGRATEPNRETCIIKTMDKSFQEFFNDILAVRGLTIEKLAELTEVPKHYLDALSSGNFSKLPAVPYTRGFLSKIAEVLAIDGDELWRTYKDEIILNINTSDKLPFNRFAIRRFGKIKIIIGIILISAIIYLVWQSDNLLGIPKIEIANPAEDNLVLSIPLIKLAGKISNPKDKLTVNNEQIFINSDGSFEKEIFLRPGVNDIEFKIKRFLGKETKIVRKVVFQPQNIIEETSQ